jgi:hypothetical protein
MALNKLSTFVTFIVGVFLLSPSVLILSSDAIEIQGLIDTPGCRMKSFYSSQGKCSINNNSNMSNTTWYYLCIF